jgi:hypothetical protein
MKNLFIAASLFFALGVSAQETKQPVAATQKVETVNYDDMAKKNAADLAAFIPMSQDQQNIFTELFRTKFNMLHGSGELTEERKQVIYNQIERKLEATLDGPDFSKVKANTKLFNELTR